MPRLASGALPALCHRIRYDEEDTGTDARSGA